MSKSNFYSSKKIKNIYDLHAVYTFVINKRSAGKIQALKVDNGGRKACKKYE